MTIPAFSAEASLYKTNGHLYTPSGRLQTDGRARITPALPPGGAYPPPGLGCFAAKRWECLKTNKPYSECDAWAKQECAKLFPPPSSSGGGGGGGCSPLFPTGSGLPIYGNYCGPGHGDPTGATPPVDAVDAVCRAHDLCYGATNMFNCACDHALIANMQDAIDATPCLTGKLAGHAARDWFANAPCYCYPRACGFWGCVTSPIPIIGHGGFPVC